MVLIILGFVEHTDTYSSLPCKGSLADQVKFAHSEGCRDRHVGER